ncbi:MAG: site-2 protease family protein [Acidobacteria bacterium]|nr:site-2 protease family protein [Acidobacteriota bacterium]MBK9705999.1 site-2 protease family protein [Acidobacteriota bacterium]
MNIDPGRIIMWFVIFLLSLTVHECAHAWAAEKSGDSTGRYLGRVTLNPIPHIDVFGTIIFPLIAITTGGWMFGWAKPVPFNSMNLRNRKWGEIIIASAGPISNLMLVAIFLVLFRIFFRNPLISPDALGELAQPIAMMLGIGMSLNIILAVFNLIPVPPLDGSHVLRNLLPDSLAEKYEQIPAWAGFIVLFLLVRIGFTSLLTTPIFNLVEKILSF